jgi:hypothetical protein
MPMSHRTNVRFTVDIPAANHKKLKMLATFHGKSMREMLVEFIEHGLEDYQECTRDHTPNEVTKKAVANVEARKCLKTAKSVEDLFKKLSE